MFYYNRGFLLIYEIEAGVTKSTSSGQNNDLIFFFFQFSVKYHHVGKLLKNGEEPTVYSDEEEKDAQDAKKD